MHEFARRVARRGLWVSLCLLAMSVAPACADSVTFSKDSTPIVSADWTDLGAGPALIQNHSTKGVYIAAAAAKPAAGAIGHWLIAEMGARAFETPLHLWARAAVEATTATSPVLEVTSTAGVGQSVVAAIDQTTQGVTNKVVSGPTNVVCVTPTITASTYAANQPIGGVITFANAFGSLNSGMLHTLSVTSKTAQTAALLAFPLANAPGAPANLADHATANIAAADVSLVRAPISLATPYTNLGTHAVWGADGIGKLCKSADTSLRIVLVPTATTSAFGSTTDVQVCVKVSSDN